MTVDGYPGTVTSTLDGPYPQTESYDVTLDNGMGGGEYRVGDLSPYVANTASRVVESDLVEASTLHVAYEDYPELQEILHERLPNENLKYTAAKKPFGADEEDDDGSSDAEDSGNDRQEEGEDQGEEEAVAEPDPIDPPDACSFCGNDSFEDPQNTGRGTRMRCQQCKGTMTSWGGQWQPETPGSSQNEAVGTPDYRSGGAGGVASLPDANFKVSVVDHDLSFHMTSSWRDVREKAKRLRKDGFVKITGATNSAVLGEVTGDTAIYETELKYLPGGRKVATYYCGCAWANYANEPRFGQFKKFQDRLCSHALALQFEAQSQGMFGRAVTAAFPDQPSLGEPYEPSDQSFFGGGHGHDEFEPHENDEEGEEEKAGPLAEAEEAAPLMAAASILDPDGIYSTDVDLLNPPLYAFAQKLTEGGNNPISTIKALQSLGASRAQAQMLLYQAKQEATADADGGQGLDAMAPRQTERDQSDKETEKKHRLHHTNDGREHAPNWGWGLPYWMQGNLETCSQCNGSGCGHCGGMGQVQQGGAPAVGDNTGDAGDMSNGIAATGNLDFFAELEEYNTLPGGTATGEPWRPQDPHSNSQNPASTGWATGDDPQNWDQGEELGKNTFGGSFVSSLKENPSVSGVALHAQDTGRVLMIQRSNNDDSDPAKGTWEFPGGHHEDGDQTSLHAGIREWEEEVGQPFPEGGVVKGTHFSGPYALHKVEIPSESQVNFGDGRSTVNPDDPDGDDHEQSAWWDPKHAEDNPALRKELQKPKVWDHVKNADLHSEPEPALPSTDGASEEEEIIKQFQATAGAAAIADIPELRRTAMRTFDYAEQQALINEGAREKVRARNFDDLQIAGTHYALLEDDDLEDLGSYL